MYIYVHFFNLSRIRLVVGLCLLFLFFRVALGRGHGGALLKDGTEGHDDVDRLLDHIGGHIQLLQRGDEVTSHQIEVSYVEPLLREQTLVLFEHVFLDVDRLGDGGEGHSQEPALVFLESFHVHPLEEIGELVIGNDLAVEDVDGSCVAW